MALPEVTFSINDFALGVVPQNTANLSVKLGIAAGGTPNKVYSFQSPTDMKAQIGVGPAIEAASYTMATAGGPVMIVPILPTTFSGGALALTKIGTGAGTATVTQAPWRKILLRISFAGVLGTSKFQLSFDNGTTYTTTEYVTAASVTLDQSLTQITMAAGAYVLSEVYTLNTDGTISQSGAGPAITSTASQNAITDNFDVTLTITKAGALGVAEFKISLDGGDTYNAIAQVPAGGKFVVPDAGFFILFAATFDKDTIYKDSAGTLVTAQYTTTELNAAFDALFANASTWGHAHVLGAASDMTTSGTLFTAIATKMATAETSFRYAFAVMELPDVSDATISGSATFNILADRRVSVAAGYEELFSAITGRVYKRSVAWAASARCAQVPFGEDKAFVGRGPLVGISSLKRDEFATPNLDQLRYTTLRTLIGAQGFYLSNGKIFAPSGSDFSLMQHRMVMDQACTTARAALLPFLNGSIRVDKVTGKINEKDASQIEARVNSQMKAVLVDTGNASDTSVQIDRNANIISTGVLPVTIRVTPLGYMKTISVNIGFENPALVNT